MPGMNTKRRWTEETWSAAFAEHISQCVGTEKKLMAMLATFTEYHVLYQIQFVEDYYGIYAWDAHWAGAAEAFAMSGFSIDDVVEVLDHLNQSGRKIFYRRIMTELLGEVLSVEGAINVPSGQRNVSIQVNVGARKTVPEIALRRARNLVDMSSRLWVEVNDAVAKWGKATYPHVFLPDASEHVDTLLARVSSGKNHIAELHINSYLVGDHGLSAKLFEGKVLRIRRASFP